MLITHAVTYVARKMIQYTPVDSDKWHPHKYRHSSSLVCTQLLSTEEV